ncbi:heavy-metal-associated domain-containing protein [Candidatus Woesearchaeota archaeon]|nr:heavy-metal-associated domain-containing protein [Candidatus Woesearchaeota archaeon]
MKRINLKIKGIHCPSCEMLIEDALDSIRVTNFEVNRKGEATIEFDENTVKEEAIKKTIKQEGYQIE